jgi:hypothetical protein
VYTRSPQHLMLVPSTWLVAMSVLLVR